MIHYGMTKTAQLAVSRGLAEMTRGTAVTVNSVLPGPTMSEGVETFVKDLAKQNGQSVEEAASQFVKQFRPTSLLQRFASVEEIANMVVYVSSKEASATNGAALRAEGGIVQTIAPLGPSPRVLEAIRGEATDTLRLYPDPQATALRAALATYHQVRPEQVFVGNGSDEVLAHAFAALLKHDAPLLFPDITYSFYPVYCRLFGIAYEAVPLDQAMQIRVADYRRPAGALIVPNPNAPTGVALSRAEIVTLLEEHPDAPVVIDEAYVDFGAETAIPLVASHPNLLVVQTMSKSRAPGRAAGWLCDRRRRPDRGAHPGEGQLQLLSSWPARPGRRHRLPGGRSLFSTEPRSRDRRPGAAKPRTGPAWLRSAAVLRQLRLRASSGA